MEKIQDNYSDDSLLQLEEETPRGSFGNVLHMLTFGLFGEQEDRINKHVATEYQVKRNNNNNQTESERSNEEWSEYPDSSTSPGNI